MGGSDHPVSDRRQHLRLFLSADLVDGTTFKNRHPVEGAANSTETWPPVFEQFFRSFGSKFRGNVRSAREDESDHAMVAMPPRLWKINGDELLFTELVYPDKEKRFSTLGTTLRAFVETVQEFDEKMIPLGMGVKGCVWTAGFPLRNKYLRIVDSSIDIMPGRVELDPDTGEYEPTQRTVSDYLGRDIDLGFRLTGSAVAMRIACSLDVAQLVTDLPPHHGLRIHHVGWGPLKGILDGEPYPILWLETARETPVLRHPWEDSGVASPEIMALLEGETELSKDKFDKLADVLDHQFPQYMIRAYASSTEMNTKHRVTWNANKPDDYVDEIVTSTETIPADKYGIAPEQVETITMDDLNQILMYLQEEPGAQRLLRRVLLEVGRHPSYAAWAEHAEYEGLMFRMDNSLAFESDRERRLLELLKLVESDALRVKLHVRGEQVFITDGLWVAPAIRVFPFIDESDLVLRTYKTAGLADWATCVIDPATGCGHNALRYQTPDVRRYGFDRSPRAISYAAINALVNEADNTLFAVNDVRTGLPPVFAHDHERVLVLANMPFVLTPSKNVILRTAEGGRHGFEMIVAMLDAVNALGERLPPGSELRCVSVAYSVGSVHDDSWAVADKAAERFGSAHVNWSLMDGERLWRVNGKKEQPNPMPLSALKRKADCRFYVRREANRERIRAEYGQLAHELESAGYTHLGYGALTITFAAKDSAAQPLVA